MTRGFEGLIPQYPRDLFVTEDLAYWEATYRDGHVVRESDGGSYRELDRVDLFSFRIIHAGEITFEFFMPFEGAGRHLIYRRRTRLGQSGGGRDVLFLIGLVPMGPAFAISLTNGSYDQRPEGFVVGDPVFYPPALTPEELDYQGRAS